MRKQKFPVMLKPETLQLNVERLELPQENKHLYVFNTYKKQV